MVVGEGPEHNGDEEMLISDLYISRGGATFKALCPWTPTISRPAPIPLHFYSE
jgi:hypothetical protein